MKLALILILSLVLCVAVQAADKPIISEQLSLAISNSPNQSLKVWLYFDSTQKAEQPISLSERALARRAKVDPINYLISETDYPLKPELLESIRSSGLDIKFVSRWFKAIVVELPGERVGNLLTLPGLKRLDLSRTMLSFSEPDKERFGFEALALQDSAFYGLSYIQNKNANIIKLHNAGFTGQGVLIAMFDTGFNPNHQAFDSVSIIATWDFINNREAVDGADCDSNFISRHQDWHGTATWSVIGSYVPDTMIGSAYNADFALAKTEITCDGTEIKAEEYNWIAAAEWADSLGADIITASLGYYSFQDLGSYTQDQLDGNTALITIAADLAASKNILMINSAGNERGSSWGTITFPADGDSVLAVAAMTPSRIIAGYSSPGPSADGRIKPEIATQGSSVRVANTSDNGWMALNGTSLAAPMIAGSAALIMESGPSLTAQQVREMIINSGDQVDNPDNDFGYGIFDAVKAADIIKWDSFDRFYVEKIKITSFLISTTGRFKTDAILNGVDLPPGITLNDQNDGTGQLVIDEFLLNNPSLTIYLTAQVDQFIDTTSIVIMTYEGPQASVSVGPNPFSDSINIFVFHPPFSPVDQITITVFNLAGEKIREIINISPELAETIEWDGRNSAGRQIAPGMYIILVQSDVMTQQLKVLKTK